VDRTAEYHGRTHVFSGTRFPICDCTNLLQWLILWHDFFLSSSDLSFGVSEALTLKESS
jgi:hypothetical protein